MTVTIGDDIGEFDVENKIIKVDGFILPVNNINYYKDENIDYGIEEPAKTIWFNLGLISFIGAFFTNGVTLILMFLFFWIGTKVLNKKVIEWEKKREEYMNTPEILKEKAKYKSFLMLFQYYKNTIPTYSELKDTFEFLGADTFEDVSADHLIYKVYQRAFDLGANGIVINNNDVSNEVSGTTSGYVSGGANNTSVYGSTHGSTSTKTTFYKHVSFVRVNKG